MVAQTTIAGTVVDNNDMPLPGANVTVEGKDAYSITDFDGKFSLQAEEGDVLNFSYLGFKSQKITIGSETELTVVLEPDAAELDEVVVIGFGTQKKADVTGAVSSVKSEELMKQPAPNAVQSIQGKLSGVNITNTNAPGSTPNITIRGTGTAFAGGDVLYIVDGVQVNSITNINPADIETMDVLKDAASASIYGMNAANGVIIITTKKGKEGKAKISLESYYGAKSILNPVDMANASQYVTYFNERQAAMGEPGRLAPSQPYNTDWLDEVSDVGFSNSNNVAISGATEKFNYFFSFNNYNEDGVLDDQKFSRNTIRANNSAKLLNERLTITSNLSASFNKSTPKPFSVFTDAFRQAPIVPVYYDRGAGYFGQSYWSSQTGLATYIDSDGQLNSTGNPVQSVYFTNEENKVTDLQGSFQAELQIIDGLKATSRFAATKSYGRRRIFNDNLGIWLADPTQTLEMWNQFKANSPEATTYANNSLYYATSEDYRYNWDTFVTLDKVIKEKHNLNVVAGLTKGMKGDSFNLSSTGYEVPSKEQYWNIDLNSGDYPSVTNQSFSTPITQLSYFGRVQYNYDSRYYAQVNFRRDGVSTFRNAAGDGASSSDFWGNFPSFSLGWNISNEAFFDADWVNFLKLRGGWGRMGNSEVPFNIATYLRNAGSADMNYVFGANQNLFYGAALGAPVYPISWEITEETNIGADFRLFDSRLSGNMNYYYRNTPNLILEVNPVGSSGVGTRFFDHGAEVTNEGFEIELNWRDNITDDLAYSIGGTFSTNKNRVQNVAPAYDGQIGGSLGNGSNTKRLEEGQPLYAWWMYEADGVWQTQEEIDNNASLPGASPGHLRYADQNGDGIIDDRDKKFFGSYLPTFNYGINLGVTYKRFDLTVETFGAGGNKVYNGLNGVRVNGGENVSMEMFNGRWTEAGSSNSKPGADRDSEASSYYLENGDFFRINNITIGYTLNNVIDQISRIRIYATAQNPFIFTKYSGYTPEVIGTAAGNAGVELSAYPNIKTFLFGVNVDL